MSFGGNAFLGQALQQHVNSPKAAGAALPSDVEREVAQGRTVVEIEGSPARPIDWWAVGLTIVAALFIARLLRRS